jgi:hypothetical protein
MNRTDNLILSDLATIFDCRSAPSIRMLRPALFSLPPPGLLVPWPGQYLQRQPAVIKNSGKDPVRYFLSKISFLWSTIPASARLGRLYYPRLLALRHGQCIHLSSMVSAEAVEVANVSSVSSPASTQRAPPSLSFALASSPDAQSKFGPRTGHLVLSRPERQGRDISIETPGLLTGTSRGVVPHLAWDVYAQHARDENSVLKWVNIPWETLYVFSLMSV